MSRRIETSVLIVGGGPVGMTLALDLAWRGIDVTIAELRQAGEPPSPKCNQVSARSMEIYRRLGVAGKIRDAGLPADYPNDVVSCTSVTGFELSRLNIPCRAERFSDKKAVDAWWPTPEPSHRINQIFFEPALFAHAQKQPRIRILNRTRIDEFAQDQSGVAAVAQDLESGERFEIFSAYLAGCDGSKSMVRQAIGGRLAGTAEIQRVQSTFIRAPNLMERLPGKRAWMFFALNPQRCGTVIAVDGRETWIIHNFLYGGEPEFDSIHRDWAIRAILGVGADFDYEVISKEDWVGRRLVADRFRDRRAFICGDAAHLWIPNAGYGMNAGIADAATLAWMIAATLKSWAPATILDAYESERQPITEQVSHFAMNIALDVIRQRCAVPANVESAGADGAAARARIGAEAHAIDYQQQCASGLNFGYFYDRSPIIAYDGARQPGYTISDFTSSTIPGCRLPHLWLRDGRSLYDALGPDYTLIRLDPALSVSGIVAAAAEHGLPLRVLDIDAPDARARYARPLVLARPDQHIAWRGDTEPAEPSGLIDLIRGARAAIVQEPLRARI
jgi:2-polyprenyl-6-methoxyphenol hydroxylase-like FAD-dependent oxidoreductase